MRIWFSIFFQFDMADATNGVVVGIKTAGVFFYFGADDLRDVSYEKVDQQGGIDSFWVVNVATCFVNDKFDHAPYSCPRLPRMSKSLIKPSYIPIKTEYYRFLVNSLQCPRILRYRRINLCALSGAWCFTVDCPFNVSIIKLNLTPVCV